MESISIVDWKSILLHLKVMQRLLYDNFKSVHDYPSNVNTEIDLCETFTQFSYKEQKLYLWSTILFSIITVTAR